MAKFRYYVTDTMSGTIRGSDDKLLAESVAGSEDFFVVDTETGEWIQPESIRLDVEEFDPGNMDVGQGEDC